MAEGIRATSKWEKVSVMRVEDMDKMTRDTLIVALMFCPNCLRYHNEVYIYGNPSEGVNYCSFCGADMRSKDERSD